MALITTGLTSGGVTAHYQFQYDDSLAAPLNPGGPEPARTNAVIAASENDFNLMAGWFGNVALDVNFTIAVNVTQNGGGSAWNRSGRNLTVTINPAAGIASFIRYLLISEMVEQIMRAQGLGWFGSGTEGSEGEGLSRFLATQFLAVNGFGNSPPPGFANSNTWLATVRADFVNNITPTDDGPDAITGCALLFIYYLSAQLTFSVNRIVAAGAPTLTGVYKNLTADPVDPFPGSSNWSTSSFRERRQYPTRARIPTIRFPFRGASSLSTRRYLIVHPLAGDTIRKKIRAFNAVNLRVLLNSDRRASLLG